MIKYLLLFVLSACSGVPSTSGTITPDGSVPPPCGKIAWSNTIGALPSSTPNQTPPGFITAVVANGSPALTITYQPTFGSAVTGIISAGNGSWQKDNYITSVTSTSSTFTINSSVFTVSGASVTGSGAWVGSNSGVGQIDGSATLLEFHGYSGNSVVTNAPLTFISTCN
jgi:hypothetical protein